MQMERKGRIIRYGVDTTLHHEALNLQGLGLLGFGRSTKSNDEPKECISAHLKFLSNQIPQSSDFPLREICESTDSMYLNSTIPDIPSNPCYNDLDAQRFWEEKLTNHAANAGLMAFDAVYIYIYILGGCLRRRRWLRW